ncbi:3-methyl-2-oxobutanoate hydroxymethyltransferase [Venturia nashicola]|nr:3-methyl-2-oxobutanoate hydroxymethyltransferase [Venturia nashicola]
MPPTYSRDRSNIYRDLRSASVPKRRERTRNYKYYNFSVVKAGQLNIQDSQPNPHPQIITQWHNPNILEVFELPTVYTTRKELYNEAQRTAPRHRHQSCCWKYDRDHVKNAQRHEIEAKKIATGLNSKGECWDFNGLNPQRLHDYLLDDFSEELKDDVGVDVWNSDDERPLSPCQCDDCVWARYGYIPFPDEEGDPEVYEGTGTLTAEPTHEEEEDWTGWFTHEGLFDQSSQLVDAAMDQQDAIVKKEIRDLGWVDACEDEEPEDINLDIAGWLEVWDPDWLNFPALAMAESKHSFEII